MKTIKCKITNEIDVSEYLQKYNSVLHISYNCLKSGVSQPNIKKLVNPKFEGLILEDENQIKHNTDNISFFKNKSGCVINTF